VVRVAPRYVIADPIREPMPIEEEHPVDESLIEDLERLADEGETEMAIITRALLHIIERLDRR